MENGDAKKQNSSIYYNIDIYNDNSTNGDISSKFQTAFNSPLLMDTSNYEVAVARARIPCDQIPLSQDNIPFEKWKIEIGVKVINSPDYIYYNSYVPQFNPGLSQTLIYDTANIGFPNALIQKLTFLGDPTPLGDTTYTLTPSIYGVYSATLWKSPRLSSISFGKDYFFEVISLTAFNVRSYVDGSIVANHSILSSPGIDEGEIWGICSSQSGGNLYILVYELTRSDLVMLCYTNPFVGTNFEAPILGSVPSNAEMISLSCGTIYLSVSLYQGNTCTVTNFGIGNSTGYPFAINFQPTPVLNAYLYTYIDVNNVYYQAEVFTTLRPGRPSDFRSYDIISPGIPYINIFFYNPTLRDFTRFMGSDIQGNIMACYTNELGGYNIESYSPSGGTYLYYLNTVLEPILLSTFATQTVILPPGQSLTPNYQVMTINEYLRQINLAFTDIFNQIPTPLSSPVIAPRLVFDSAGVGTVSIVCDPGCASSLSTACVINFNQLLWSFFKFISIQAVNTAIGGSARTLTINNAVPGKNSSTAQPTPTLYRFSDLTRIIISTSRMGVLGDNEKNNQILVNIGDFTIDTENGIPNLVIYNPEILRFYKLYQNTPLTNIDVFISYADRAGNVFPITISPYNSIGLKLEFKRIPLEKR